MVRPRGVLFDIGSTLWASPAEDPQALLDCYGRGRAIILESTSSSPEIEALIEAVEGHFAAWEDIWRSEAGRVEQPPTHEYVAEALLKLDVTLELAALIGFTDAILETSVYTAKVLAPEPGMSEALAALRQRGLVLGCVSNAFMRAAVLHQIMIERGLGQHIDYTISSCEAGIRKPDARIYEAALAAMGLTGPETIFVGDRLDADVEGPSLLGMRTVLTQQYRAEDPTQARVQPDAVIAHLSDLVAYVDTLLQNES